MAETFVASGTSTSARSWRLGSLFRAISAAIDARKLVLGALALGLANWIDRVLLGRPALGLLDGESPFATGDLLGATARGALLPQAALDRIVALFQPGSFWPELGATLLILAAWGVLGCAIARIWLVQHATGDRHGLFPALRFALVNFVPLIAAPFAVLAAIGFLSVFLGPIGWLQGSSISLLSGLGNVLTGLALLVGTVMSWLVIGLLAGWPMMVAAVAAEGEDTFDALSRSFSYTFQRPLRYGASIAAAALAGALGFLFAIIFYRLTLLITGWGLTALNSAAGVSEAWVGVATHLLLGGLFSYFWCASAQIYVLLREEIDGTPEHDLALPGEGDLPYVPEPPAGSGKPPATPELRGSGN